jgi:serine/threonine protein kinase
MSKSLHISDSRVRDAKGNSLREEYDFIEILGQGAFGQVWKVRRKSGVPPQGVYSHQGVPSKASTPVALKLIQLGNLITPRMSESEKKRKLDGLLREITIMKKLSNGGHRCMQYVVCLYDAVQGTFQGQMYIALEMELVDSPDLWKNIRKRREPPPPERHFTYQEVETMFYDLLQALNFMHRKGIVHRDIKAENVFWDEKRQRAILGDFGLSCLYQVDCKGWAGTLSYNHPEVLQQLGCRGSLHNWDLEIRGTTNNILWKKNDIYGVGLLMREALNLDTASASCSDNKLLVEVPGIPANLPEKLRRALEKSQNPDMRKIPSAEELMRILRPGRGDTSRRKKSK